MCVCVYICSHTYVKHKMIQNENSRFAIVHFSSSRFAQQRALRALLHLFWLSSRAPGCATQYLRASLCVRVCVIMCVCVCRTAEMGRCERGALTPSSLLSHWLTAERLKGRRAIFRLQGQMMAGTPINLPLSTITQCKASRQQPCHAICKCTSLSRLRLSSPAAIQYLRNCPQNPTGPHTVEVQPDPGN